jgi:hypothetical protein
LLDGVESRMERQLSDRDEASKTSGPVNGSAARTEHLTIPGARTSTRSQASAREKAADVKSWLAGAHPRARPLTSARPTPPGGLRASAETSAAALPPDPWLTDTVDTGSSSGGESWLTDLKSGVSPAVSRPAHPVNARATEMRQELDALPVPDDGPGSNGAGVEPGGANRASLGEMMRRLDSFYSGLVTMERRLDTTDESYSKVTDRWQPIQDTPAEQLS